jgi:acyl-CoA synthetase (AMP-forming)/AMP-acid ligase II
LNQIIIDQFQNQRERVFIDDALLQARYTYGDIYEKSLAIANFLAAHGIKKGSKVAIILSNCVEFVTIYFANLFLGAVSIPISPNFRLSDYQFILNQCHPDIILTSSDRRVLLQDVAIGRERISDIDEAKFFERRATKFQFEKPQMAWEDTIAVLFTSGTTGRPKGVVVRLGAVLENLRYYGTLMKFGADTRFMQIVPLFHTHGWLYSSIVPALFGSSVVLNEPFNVRLCSNFWNLTARYQANVLVCVPSILTSLLEMKERWETAPTGLLDYVICGSAFLHVELKKKFEQTFATSIYEFYGSTETLYIAFYHPGLEYQAKTVGKLFPENCQARVAADGEILVKTKYIFKEYLQETEQTREAFDGEWYKTGDIGLVGEDGYIELTGRKKDIINKGGYKVSPKEVSDCLLRHEAVKEAVTIGVRDLMYGEEIYTFVEREESFDTTEAELLQYCKKWLNPMICPKKIIIVAEIPKNAAGKFDKFKLTELFNELYDIA